MIGTAQAALLSVSALPAPELQRDIHMQLDCDTLLHEKCFSLVMLV